MAKLNVNNFSKEYQDVAPKECSLYLFECFPEDIQKRIKEDWEKAGGRNKIPWWKWCFENIEVSYQNEELKKANENIAELINMVVELKTKNNKTEDIIEEYKTKLEKNLLDVYSIK